MKVTLNACSVPSGRVPPGERHDLAADRRGEPGFVDPGDVAGALGHLDLDLGGGRAAAAVLHDEPHGGLLASWHRWRIGVDVCGGRTGDGQGHARGGGHGDREARTAGAGHGDLQVGDRGHNRGESPHAAVWFPAIGIVPPSRSGPGHLGTVGRHGAAGAAAEQGVDPAPHTGGPPGRGPRGHRSAGLAGRPVAARPPNRWPPCHSSTCGPCAGPPTAPPTASAGGGTPPSSGPITAPSPSASPSR